MTGGGAFTSAFSDAFNVSVIEPAPELLSSREEVESIFSADGVALRIDDNLDGLTDGTSGSENDTARLIDVLIEASDEGYQKLDRYADDQLCASRWVRRRVSYIAAHLLSIRRGNPAQYVDKYEQYMKAFQDIKEGRAYIPRAKPRADFGPSMSVLVVDDHYGVNKVRVISDASEGQIDAKQHLDRLPYRGYYGWWW